MESLAICGVQALLPAGACAEDIQNKGLTNCSQTKNQIFNHLLHFTFACHCEAQNCRPLIPTILSTLPGKALYIFLLKVTNWHI
jgi:hypothetical protein